MKTKYGMDYLNKEEYIECYMGGKRLYELEKEINKE